MRVYWQLVEEGFVGSLEEFRYLTLAQVTLFTDAIRKEHERVQLEQKLNNQLRQRQGGGPIRVVG